MFPGVTLSFWSELRPRKCVKKVNENLLLVVIDLNLAISWSLVVKYCRCQLIVALHCFFFLQAVMLNVNRFSIMSDLKWLDYWRLNIEHWPIVIKVICSNRRLGFCEFLLHWRPGSLPCLFLLVLGNDLIRNSFTFTTAKMLRCYIQ